MIQLIGALCLISGAFLLTNKRYRWIYIICKTFKRDIIAGWRFLKLNITIQQWQNREETIPKVFTKLVKKHPHKIAFYCEDQKWTFQQIEDLSNKVANYFLSLGYKKGDTVALLLENRPEYVALWLGLSKIGVITALINTNLVQDPLIHSIAVAKSQALIFGTDFTQTVNSIKNKIGNVKLFEFNTGQTNHVLDEKCVKLNLELESQSTKLADEIIQETKPRDKIVYIYTSGTTGLPKAAVISNVRFMFMVIGVHFMVDIKQDDVYYNPLPLYHTAGGMVGAGQAVIFGVTVAIRKKFSASNYWADCQKYGCTISNYIGEICRYLLLSNKGEKPKHPVKKIVGNGMRPQIWKEFVKRFGIEYVYEFYGSTEGNSNLINIDNTVGAVGFVPRYAQRLYPVVLIRCTEDTGEPIRNEQGYCTRCEVDEPGVLIGKINPKRSHQEFTGYADEKATKKKILDNVFVNGDMYFNSGDVLVQDELGYIFFKDRTGDTYRWKGENVATSEVENVINSVVDANESAVYGVEVPGAEGRAGMAAIADPDNKVDLDRLAKGLKSNLPSYAVPLFLRIMDSVPLTGTFKIKKVDLQKEAYNIDKVPKTDKLYFFDLKNSRFVEVTRDLYDDIVGEKLKL